MIEDWITKMRERKRKREGKEKSKRN